MTTLTASGQIAPAFYGRAHALGFNTVWGGQPETCAAARLRCLAHGYTEPHPALAGVYFGEDPPVSRLAQLQGRAVEWQQQHEGLPCLVTVPATYTRVLPKLGVSRYHHYLQQVAATAFRLTPILCHYPLRDPDTDEHVDAEGWREDYRENLSLMQEHFGTDWWLWVQVTGHELYEWRLREASAEEIAEQVRRGRQYGAAGFGFFCWNDIRAEDGWAYPGIDRRPEALFTALEALKGAGHV